MCLAAACVLCLLLFVAYKLLLEINEDEFLQNIKPDQTPIHSPMHPPITYPHLLTGDGPAQQTHCFRT